MNPDEPVRNAHEVSVFFTLAAMAGGLLWGMIRVTAVVGGPAPYDRSDVVKASVDALCALVSAFISALFISPGVVAWMGIEDLRMMGIIYLAIGLVFWQVAPFISRLLVKAIPDIIATMLAQRGAKSTQEASDESR